VAEPVFRWALYDREPLTAWSTATTTLLGDAAHPMLPYLAQGAAQSIEDAAALAVSIEEDIPAALSAYEARRRAHTARIQRLAWENNVVFHLADGDRQCERDADLAAGRGYHPYGMSWLYGNKPAA
jgi:salicylate hydroxylase